MKSVDALKRHDLRGRDAGTSIAGFHGAIIMTLRWPSIAARPQQFESPMLRASRSRSPGRDLSGTCCCAKREVAGRQGFEFGEKRFSKLVMARLLVLSA